MNDPLLAPFALKWNPFCPAVPTEALLATPAVAHFLRRIETLQSYRNVSHGRLPTTTSDVHANECSDINTDDHADLYTKPDPNEHTDPYTNRDAHCHPNPYTDQHPNAAPDDHADADPDAHGLHQWPDPVLQRGSVGAQRHRAPVRVR